MAKLAVGSLMYGLPPKSPGAMVSSISSCRGEWMFVRNDDSPTLSNRKVFRTYEKVGSGLAWREEFLIRLGQVGHRFSSSLLLAMDHG